MITRSTLPRTHKDHTAGAEMFVLYYLRHMARSPEGEPDIRGCNVHVVTTDDDGEGASGIRSNTRHDISIGFVERKDGLMLVFVGIFTSNPKESYWHSFETEVLPRHAAREHYAKVSQNATWRGTITA